MLLGPNRVAVVTGAASGIGRAPALHLAQKGCALALVDVNEDGLNETASIVALAGRKASLHVVDVSNLSQMQAFPEAVLRHHSAIHILVNNAGVSLASPFESATLEDMQWVAGINLWGAIYGCKFFLPYLRRESEALRKAILRERLPTGLIVHSDRGGQYVDTEFRGLLNQHGFEQSMSRADETYDNAHAESLFSRYKAELLEDGAFADIEQARSETFAYIEGYYNRVRRHSALGYLSPEDFERACYQRAKGRKSLDE